MSRFTFDYHQEAKMSRRPSRLPPIHPGESLPRPVNSISSALLGIQAAPHCQLPAFRRTQQKQGVRQILAQSLYFQTAKTLRMNSRIKTDGPPGDLTRPLANGALAYRPPQRRCGTATQGSGRLVPLTDGLGW